MRSDRARQGERKCDVYQLSRDTSEFIKCQHHAAITVQARERAVDEAAARRSPTFENQALRR